MSEERNIEERNKAQGTSDKEQPASSNDDDKATTDKPATSNQQSTFAPQQTELPESTGASADKPETENMEVHKHPHHVTHKKKWGEYLLEFIMLFLAVFLGFLAENQREHMVEHTRAVEFAKQLYSELSDDSVVAANKVKIRLEKEKDINYLVGFFRDSSLTTLSHQFYPAYTTVMYLINTYAFEPKDGILSQLRNSGSLRYFKSTELQKLLGDLSVYINNVRYRNDQEYQYFSNPIKAFLLKYYDWTWMDKLRQEDPNINVLDLINKYRNNHVTIEGRILNPTSFNREEVCNMILFYKQMLVSTRTLQLNNYITTNHKVLQELRNNYQVEK